MTILRVVEPGNDPAVIEKVALESKKTSGVSSFGESKEIKNSLFGSVTETGHYIQILDDPNDQLFFPNVNSCMAIAFILNDERIIGAHIGVDWPGKSEEVDIKADMDELNSKEMDEAERDIKKNQLIQIALCKKRGEDMIDEMLNISKGNKNVKKVIAYSDNENWSSVHAAVWEKVLGMEALPDSFQSFSRWTDERVDPVDITIDTKEIIIKNNKTQTKEIYSHSDHRLQPKKTSPTSELPR